MMKITHTEKRREEKTKIKNKKSLLSVDKKQCSFETELKTSLKFNFEDNLQELFDDLKDQEKRFLDEQSFYELSRYKSLVQKILKTLTNDGFQTRTLQRNRRDRADFIVAEQINEKLHEITIAITHSNKAFNLMKTIEEIRGLIFDFSF